MRMSRSEWEKLRKAAPDGVCEAYPYLCADVLAIRVYVPSLSCRCVNDEFLVRHSEAEVAPITCANCGGATVSGVAASGVCLECD